MAYINGWTNWSYAWTQIIQNVILYFLNILTNHINVGAHVDVSQNEELYGCGLNWTIDPDDADMVWYNMPDVDPERTKRSETDINYEWPLEQLTEVDRCCIGQTATLVRTNIPHTVEMRDNERWLVSARFLWHTTWEDYMQSFKQRIIQ